MKRLTIDYGIDLGTTNSAITVMVGMEPKIITNKDGGTTTPSAVWIDKRGRVRVGKKAKERFEVDKANVDIEFKARMGYGDDGIKQFKASSTEMSPEQLSAEVLKSLKEDVHIKFDENLQAAVITVPAAFELRQCDATRNAASLSGFSQSPLLLEPVAAALGYGFSDEDDGVYWLVYDFGGGTFDAAVVQIRDGVVQVVNHAGDNHLGGKLIDWDIVEKLLVPHLESQYKLSNFERGNEKWQSAFAGMKSAAEEGKIEVCRTREEFVIWKEDLCEDEEGEVIDLEFKLTPEDLQSIINPYINRSLKLCRTALEEKGLDGSHMQKTLMVGGTTLIPWLRDAVEEQLKTPLEFSIDPMTVVAQGAAIFASSQRIESVKNEVLDEGVVSINLEYDPVGPDDDPEVLGVIKCPNKEKSSGGYTIEFIESRTKWTSGKIPVTSNGSFEVTLDAEEKCVNEYSIVLCDSTGSILKTSPEKITYRIDGIVEGVPLIHSLGVAMSNNQVDVFIKKGTELPARTKQIHKTSRMIQKGEKKDVLNIPIVEGENVVRADRNQLAGKLTVPANDIMQNIPIGSEVEITLNVDESRLVQAEAYIPVLDQQFAVVVNLDNIQIDAKQLNKTLSQEMSRLNSVRESARKLDDQKVLSTLAIIDQEDLVSKAGNAIATAESDIESADIATKVLKELQTLIDSAEDTIKWPVLVKEANEKINNTKRILNENDATIDEMNSLDTLSKELEDAIESGSPDVLRLKTEEIDNVGIKMLAKQPAFWIGYLQYLEASISFMSDSNTAQMLLQQGKRSIEANDIEGVKSVVGQLVSLLPPDKQKDVNDNIGFGGDTEK